MRCGNGSEGTRSRRWGYGALQDGAPGCVTTRSLALAHLAGFAHTTRAPPVLENVPLKKTRGRASPPTSSASRTRRARSSSREHHAPPQATRYGRQEGPPPRCSRVLPRADLALEDPRRALRGPQGETTSSLACAPPPARNRIRSRVQQRRARSARPFHQTRTAAIQQLPVVDMMLAGPLEVTVARPLNAIVARATPSSPFAPRGTDVIVDLALAEPLNTVVARATSFAARLLSVVPREADDIVDTPLLCALAEALDVGALRRAPSATPAPAFWGRVKTPAGAAPSSAAARARAGELLARLLPSNGVPDCSACAAHTRCAAETISRVAGYDETDNMGIARLVALLAADMAIAEPLEARGVADSELVRSALRSRPWLLESLLLLVRSGVGHGSRRT
ncbi:hypothetical protein DFH09DRAFT_1367170 [Mycena vulgaris]|nr:hypothetical protein DFH09DRAFT_1367170 [Mycena vulgaris]